MSIILRGLNKNYGYELTASIADVGQGNDFEAIVAKEYATRAKKSVAVEIGFVNRHSNFSLYPNDLSLFTMGESYDQKDATVFMKRALGLPAQTQERLLQQREVLN